MESLMAQTPVRLGKEEVSRLTTFIEQSCPDRDREDTVIWKPSGSMIYPTKIIGAKMLEDRVPILSKPVINLIWQKFIPPRA